MTSEEKVKRVYPKASCVAAVKSPRYQIWQIWSGVASPEIGLLGTAAHRESWAWADAWRNIRRTKREEGQ